MTALTFEYAALTKAGHRVRGQAIAVNEAEAFRRLTAEGLTPISVKVHRQRLNVRGISQREVAEFTSQLAVLVNARLPIGEAFYSLAEQETNPTLRAMLMDISSRIESGEPIADAMSSHKDVLGETYIKTVRAAEKSGTLGKVLDHLSVMLERTEETRRQIVGALTYPFVVVIVLCLAVIFLVGFVVPKFAKMFKARGVALPDLTRVLMFVGDAMQSYWWIMLPAVVVFAFGLRRFLRTERGGQLLESCIDRVPVIAGIVQAAAMSRFAHVLGMCLSSGLELIESIELATGAAGRRRMQKEMATVTAAVRSGGRLSDAMNDCASITPFTRRMLSTGERTGEIAHMCEIVARHYDRTASHAAKAVTTIIEPLLVVAIAGVVLVVALAIFLPMWNMVSLVG